MKLTAAVLVLVGSGLGILGCLYVAVREAIGLAADTVVAIQRWADTRRQPSATRRAPARSHVRRIPPAPRPFDQELAP